jgi:hypothetical protein
VCRGVCGWWRAARERYNGGLRRRCVRRARVRRCAWADKHTRGGVIAVYGHVEGAVHVGRKVHATCATRPPHGAYDAVVRAEYALAARACMRARPLQCVVWVTGVRADAQWCPPVPHVAVAMPPRITAPSPRDATQRATTHPRAPTRIRSPQTHAPRPPPPPRPAPPTPSPRHRPTARPTAASPPHTHTHRRRNRPHRSTALALAWPRRPPRSRRGLLRLQDKLPRRACWARVATD